MHGLLVDKHPTQKKCIEGYCLLKSMRFEEIINTHSRNSIELLSPAMHAHSKVQR